jgi:hypothetical protein
MGATLTLVYGSRSDVEAIWELQVVSFRTAWVKVGSDAFAFAVVAWKFSGSIIRF